MQKNVVQSKTNDYYKENHFIQKLHQSNPLGWIKSLQNIKSTCINKDPNDLFIKRFVKVKPAQIKIDPEEIDQENRQINMALNFVREINDNLKYEVNFEEEKIQFLWEQIQEKQTNQGKRHADRNVHSSISGNLTKNLQFQIYLAENDIKKGQKEFKSLQNTEEYFHYIENSTLNKIYKEEIERLSSLKGEHRKVEELVDQKRFQKLIQKISKNDSVICEIEGDLESTKSVINSSQLTFEDAVKTNNKLEYHLEKIMEENTDFKKSVDRISGKLIKLQKKTDDFLKENEICE